MNLLVDDINEFVDFLKEHELTADQFLFCALLASEQDSTEYNLPDQQTAISNFYEYKSLVADQKENYVWTKPDLLDLVDKGFLQYRNPDEEKFIFDNFEATEKFVDLVFEEQDDLMGQYEEFWSEYPARYETQDGKVLNIKSVNKEQLFHTYKKALKHEDHETIMECLKLAKQKDEVNTRPDKWLNSHQWDVYIDEIEDGVTDESIKQTVL